MDQRQEIYTQLKNAIDAYLGGNCSDLRPDSVLADDFGIDSTEMVCIAVDLERVLGRSLKGIRFGQLETPMEMVDAILALIATDEAAAA